MVPVLGEVIDLCSYTSFPRIIDPGPATLLHVKPPRERAKQRCLLFSQLGSQGNIWGPQKSNSYVKSQPFPKGHLLAQGRVLLEATGESSSQALTGSESSQRD